MSTNLKTPAVLMVIFGAVLQLHSQGYIVPNGVVMNFGGYFFPEEIDVLHNPNDPGWPGSYTGFHLTPVGRTEPTAYVNTFQFDPVVDVGVRVFLVAANEPISLQPILAHNYTELINPNTYVFNSAVPFYVGLYTGNVPFAPRDGIYSDPLFGWARLVNNQGAIQLLDSALVYKADGIFAGTQNFVPEPSAVGLFALGALLLGWRLQRKLRL